jgi:hypothetical protein
MLYFKKHIENYKVQPSPLQKIGGLKSLKIKASIFVPKSVVNQLQFRAYIISKLIYTLQGELE